MIGIDWGTSSFRAYRLGAGGDAVDWMETGQGIMADQDFASVLMGAVGSWLDESGPVLMSGMIGSRQGWVEAAYLPCPASAAALAGALVRVPFARAEVWIVPGVSARDAAGVPEVMRGEETQIVGAAADGLVCLPGSHSKWARVADGRILGFETYLSGEAFAAIRDGTILGRMMEAAPHDPDAFAAGVARSGQDGHLLHHLFGVRSLGLFGELGMAGSASYLSGLLIGHEVRAAMRASDLVTLLGAPGLCGLYAAAIKILGGLAVIGPANAAALGLAAIGRMAGWR